MTNSILEPARLETLLTAYQRVRQQSTRLCAPLQAEDYVVQPSPDVSPPKWHLGHTAWFFETFLLARQPGYRLFHPDYNFVFNSYYESFGARTLRTNRGNLSRPSVDDVYAYRAHVDEAMAAFMESDAAQTPEIQSLLTLGLQHEQQHQELLLTDIKYILGNNPLFPAYFDRKPLPLENVPASSPLNFLEISEGIYPIGYRGDGFCFDNELGAHRTFLHACAVADRLVTNAEYLAFMAAGGYQGVEYWLQEGWEWKKAQGIAAPLYWHLIDGQWWHYTLAGLQPVDPRAPATHVSYFEADAYARWSGQRLPTEQEWEVACQQYGGAVGAGNLLENETGQPQPARPGARQFFGDAWEWTGSAYLPYPYYTKAAGALGEYNGKFMVNQMVLRGGSCATPRDHLRATYRNFFQTDKRWQFTGIRLAKWL